jgi:hypothetical protein
VLPRFVAQRRFIEEIGVRELGLRVMGSLVARAVERGELSARRWSDRMLSLPPARRSRMTDT